DDGALALPGAGAGKGGGLVIFLRRETGHALLESREFDDDEALELMRALHDLKTAAAGQDLAAIFSDDRRHAIGVFLVLDRIVDLRTGDPICGHCFIPFTADVILRWPRSGPRGMTAKPSPSEARGPCHRAGHFGPDPLARTSG